MPFGQDEARATPTGAPICLPWNITSTSQSLPALTMAQQTHCPITKSPFPLTVPTSIISAQQSTQLKDPLQLLYRCPKTGLALRQLETAVDQYCGWGIVKSNHKIYNSGQQHYFSFSQQMGLQLLLASNISSCILIVRGCAGMYMADNQMLPLSSTQFAHCAGFAV